MVFSRGIQIFKRVRESQVCTLRGPPGGQQCHSQTIAAQGLARSALSRHLGVLRTYFHANLMRSVLLPLDREGKRLGEVSTNLLTEASKQTSVQLVASIVCVSSTLRSALTDHL